MRVLTNTMNAYFQKFEDLQALVLMKNTRVTEDFLLECFIGGLKEEIGETMRCRIPTLTRVFC